MLRRSLVFCLFSLSGLGVAHAAEGPATVADTATAGDLGGRGASTFFYLKAANGQASAETNLDASRRASYGNGNSFRLRAVERPVSPGPVKLTLVGEVAQAAPIATLFFSKDDHKLEGTVDVELRPGTRYRVNGVMDAFRREVWLEDETSQPVAGSKVVGAPNSEASAKMAGASFTCCNLRYEGDWISDANWIGQSFIPAGARIVLVEYGRNKASVLIEGRPMRLGHDYGRGVETREQFAEKLMVKDDPKLRIATFAPEVQAAIRAGKVAPGMTKEQVVISLGPPRADGTRSLDASQWLYWTKEEEEYAVIWDAEQRVKEVDGSRKVRQLVVHLP